MCIKDMSEEALTAADMPFSTPSATGSEIQLNAKYSRITPNACNEYVPSALVYRLYECDNQVTPVR